MKFFWHENNADTGFYEFRAEIGQVKELRISAFGQSRIEINGNFVGFFNESSDDFKKIILRFDVEKFCNCKSNELRIYSCFFPYRTAFLTGKHTAGIYAECDGKPLQNVQVRPRNNFDLKEHRRNIMYGIVEYYDARTKEDAFQPVTEFDYEVQFIEKDGDRFTKGELKPVAVEKTGEVLYQEYSPYLHGGAIEKLSQYLLLDVIEESKHTSFSDLNAFIKGEPLYVYAPSMRDYSIKEHYCPTIILDFGKEIAGYLHFDVEGTGGAKIDITYGEKLIGGRVTAIRQNLSYCDRYILKDGRQQHEVYDLKAFRYVQLTFREIEAGFCLYNIGCREWRYNFKQEAEFESDDVLLNRIFDVSKYTQKLCSYDHLVDCPWREQQEWLGDGAVQVMNLMYVFNDQTYTRNFFENFSRYARADGEICTVSFFDGFGCTDYPLYYAIALEKYVERFGDTNMIREAWSTIRNNLKFFKKYVNEDGFLDDIARDGLHYFIDWAKVGQTGVCVFANALYCQSMRACVRLGKMIGEDVSDLEKDIARIEDQFEDLFFDVERGLYVDNLEHGKKTGLFTVQTQVMVELSGLNRHGKDVLLNALKTQNLPEPYFCYYLCEALEKIGEGALALKIIEQNFKKMLDDGATTFYEEWQNNCSYRAGYWVARPRSLCHAWSAWSSYYVLKHIVGLYVYDDKIVVQPNAYHLNWFKAKVYVGNGQIEIEYSKESGLKINNQSEYQLMEDNQ